VGNGGRKSSLILVLGINNGFPSLTEKDYNQAKGQESDRRRARSEYAALLIYPVFPPTFWSYNKILELVDRKVLLPPLGMVTVAAILPQEWEFKLVDRNIRAVTEAEWDWAGIVILSGMIVQRQDLIEQIHEAKQRGKLVAGGQLSHFYPP
jgi:radical SAM superfamily enzyme YgiQ (UPF0313 family)